MRLIDIWLFTTYIIITTIGYSLSMVLFFSKGIKITSPKKSLYDKGKILVATSALIEAVTDTVIVFRIIYAEDYLCLNKFFVPMMFFFQMCLMLVAMLNLLHSERLSLRLGLLFTIPVIIIAILHFAVYTYQNGFDFISPAYNEYLDSNLSQYLGAFLDAAIIIEATFGIYLITQKTIRFTRNIDNYTSGPAIKKSHWLIFLVGAFMLFFVVSAADFLVSTRDFDIFTMWLKTFIFIVATVSGINLQDIYLDVRPAFNYKLEQMMTFEDLKEQPDEHPNDPLETKPESTDIEQQASDSQPAAPDSSASSPSGLSAGNQPAANNSDHYYPDDNKHANEQTEPIAAIIERWKRLPEQPYLAESITINQVSEQMKLHKRLLSQYLNNVMGINFNTWINQLKVAEVKRIIDNEPNTNMTAIADRTGFTDAPAMSRIFKNLCGMSPSAYRNRQK